jgi:subtilisin family serine protease
MTKGTRKLWTIAAVLTLPFAATAAQAQKKNQQPDPQPTIEIVSPDDGFATNADSLSVVVDFAAWVDPETGDVGNVQDVDLLRNDALIGTIPHRPPVTTGTETFEVDLSGIGDEVIVLVARAYQGNRQGELVGYSQEITVVVDRTPPEIELTWPLVDPFATDRVEVEIEGEVTDNLSGVQSVALVAPAAEDLTHPEFLTEQPLDTAIPVGAPSAVTEFELSATDEAGNSATKRFAVHYTERSVAHFVDPEGFVEIEGTVFSPQHAFILFAEETNAEQRHSIVEEFGGRITAFLTNLDAALVIFQDCADIIELNEILNDLMDTYGIDIESGGERPVTGAQFYYLSQAHSHPLDNASLAASQSAAYTDSRSDAAIEWIEANVPADQIREVKVAVVDTGLDPSFGMAAEFDGIRFIDAVPIQVGGVPLILPLDFSPPRDIDDFPHGTSVTSALAGGNNMAGNNGVAHILDGPPVQVVVYRVFKTRFLFWTLADPLSFAIAANDMLDRGFDVANLSWGELLPPFVHALGGFDRDLYRRIFSRGRDTFWVLAVGNNGTEIDRNIDCDVFCKIDLPPVLSSEYQHVIAVANHNPDNHYLHESSNYDDSNEIVQISAPGDTVYVARDVDTYGGLGGTSVAAPLVAGAAALVRAVSSVSVSDLKDILVLTGRPMPTDSPPPGYRANPHPGLDVLAAVQLGRAATGVARMSGVGRGNDGGTWETPFLSTPALNGFGFDFIGDDHHIDTVAAHVGDTQTLVSYKDKNADDEFSWFLEAAPLPPGTIYNTSGPSSSGGSCATTAVLPESGTGTFVLTGFTLAFTDDDHHIDRIRVDFVDTADGTILEVCYDNKNDDDPYEWQVRYAVVPPANVVESGSTGEQFVDPEESELDETFDLGVMPPPGAVPVIRGFGFDLESDDQHLKRLMVDISSVGVVHVKCRDESAGGIFFGLNDEYTWFVDWAFVSP